MSDTAGAARTRPYFDDPYTTAFEAAVAGVRDDARGRWVRLEPSYFYPTGGGQECDLGTLGAAAVVDVEEDEAGAVWHRLEGEAPAVGARVPATIDAVRRMGFRQQHTGQHVLSAAFERLLDAVTVSSRLGEFEGTIDLDRAALDWDEVGRVEDAANRVVFEDRPVASLVVPPEDLGRYPLRKPPRVDGPVRLIVVPDWDASPCGGTHVTRTGEIGVIKVRRWEKWRGGARVEFLCGLRALADYQDRMRALVEAGQRQHTSDREVVDVLERAAAEKAVLARELKRVGGELAESEARGWAAERAGGAPGAGVPDAAWARRVSQRDPAGLKALAAAVVRLGAPLVVVAADQPEPALVVMRARAGDGPDLRHALPDLLAAARGKGGGGPDLVTLIAADGAALEAAFTAACARFGARAEG